MRTAREQPTMGSQGVPLLMYAPKSKIQASFAGLALALGAKPGAPAAKAEKSSWIGGIFSRR